MATLIRRTREDHGRGGAHDTEEGAVRRAVGTLNGDVVVVVRGEVGGADSRALNSESSHCLKTLKKLRQLSQMNHE